MNQMRTIFLLGFMGSGKSAVARSLARELRMPLVDLDARIETQIGESIARFWAREGENAFREIETQTLRAVCDLRAVISLGGGVPTREANRLLLQNAARNGAFVVYLQTSPAILAARVRRAPGKRPLIDGEGELSLEETQKRVEALLAEREDFYRECANLEIFTDQLSVQGVARAIVERIQETGDKGDSRT